MAVLEIHILRALRRFVGVLCHLLGPFNLSLGLGLSGYESTDPNRLRRSEISALVSRIAVQVGFVPGDPERHNSSPPLWMTVKIIPTGDNLGFHHEWPVLSLIFKMDLETTQGRV